MALQYTPSAPVSGEEISLGITSATGNTDATQFELTSVPNRSALPVGALVDAGGNPVQVFTPDAPGEYGVTAYDYRRFSGGASYPGDPGGEARDELVATQSGTVYVGDEMLLPVRAGIHELTLRIVAVDDAVAAASLRGPTSEVARLAALDGTVLAAVGALVGEGIATIGQALVGDTVDLITKFSAHIASTTFHNSADAANTIPSSTITTLAGAISALALWHEKFVGHLTGNSGGWHTQIDRSNLPIVTGATTVAQATVKLVDARRVYTDHVSTVADHKAPDATNMPSANAPLSDVIEAILDFYASASPSAPDGENDGTAAAAAKYGFELS